MLSRLGNEDQVINTVSIALVSEEAMQYIFRTSLHASNRMEYHLTFSSTRRVGIFIR